MVKDVQGANQQMAVSVPTSLSKFVELNHSKIIVAIPCYNTQQSIAEVVINCKKYVEEVVVIDDGSTDTTSQTAKAAGAIVISHEKNRGKGAAMKTALKETESDIIVFIDGDGQHNPDDIPTLLEPIIQGGADFVIGSRYLSKSKTSSNPFIRKASNVIASFIISFIISFVQPIARFISRNSLNQRSQAQTRKLAKSDINNKNYRLLNGRFKWITDCTSGFTAMKKENYHKLNLLSNGFQIETEMIFEQSKNGFIIAEAPIRCNWERSSSKLSITGDGIKTLLLLSRKLANYYQNQRESAK
jgi:glycosyltransferase involved in cell wall biosynthesis